MGHLSVQHWEYWSSLHSSCFSTIYSWHSQSGLFKIPRRKKLLQPPSRVSYSTGPRRPPHNLASASATEDKSHPTFPFLQVSSIPNVCLLYFKSSPPQVLCTCYFLGWECSSLYICAFSCRSPVWKSCFLTTQSNVATSYYVILFHFCASLIIKLLCMILVSLLSAHPPFQDIQARKAMKTVTYFCLIHDYIPKCLKEPGTKMTTNTCSKKNYYNK